MFKTIEFTKNRQVIHDLLERARKFHMPFSSCYEIDCTEAHAMLRDLRRRGEPAGFSAFMVKATARLLADHPHLNRHVFTGWTGRKFIVQFDEISCNMVVQRTGRDGEKILLPLIIRGADRLPLAEIEGIIRRHKTAPLEELEEFRAFERLKRLPYWALRFASFKARSDPRFYLRHFGTYGLSTVYSFKTPALSGTAVANTAIAFLPYGMIAAPGADGATRRILRLGLVMDHYVLDGQEMAEAGYHFQRLVENPRKLILGREA